MNPKSTQTLSDSQGNPTIITYPGHVDFETFCKAADEEWEGDPTSSQREPKDIRHEYWIPHPTKAWKKVDANVPGAQKFTVMDWD